MIRLTRQNRIKQVRLDRREEKRIEYNRIEALTRSGSTGRTASSRCVWMEEKRREGKRHGREEKRTSEEKRREEKRREEKSIFRRSSPAQHSTARLRVRCASPRRGVILHGYRGARRCR